MADTTFTNGVTLSDADWFNDVNRLHYTIFSDPANAATALANLLGAARRASVYVYTAWDPTDTTGTLTNASGTAAATSTATDYLTVANASGTTTWTCVKAGVYKFSVTMDNEMNNTAGAAVIGRVALGGTATIIGSFTQIDPIKIQNPATGTTGPITATVEFYASMTANQTITVLPKIAVNGGAAATTTYTTNCTVAAEYMGA